MAGLGQMILEFCETFLRIKYHRTDTLTEGEYAHRSIQSRLRAAERTDQIEFLLNSMWQSFVLTADSFLQSDL